MLVQCTQWQVRWKCLASSNTYSFATNVQYSGDSTSLCWQYDQKKYNELSPKTLLFIKYNQLHVSANRKLKTPMQLCKILFSFSFSRQPDDGYIIAETRSWLYFINKSGVWTEYIIRLVISVQTNANNMVTGLLGSEGMSGIGEIRIFVLHFLDILKIDSKCYWRKLLYFSIDNAHLMYNAHPKLFRHSFWCIDNAHDAN
jgi:hypothetical protein